MEKFKLLDIFNIYNMLIEMGERVAPLKVSYWVTKNITLLKNDYLMYLNKRNEIWSQLLYENEDGTIATKDDNGLYRFNCKKENEEEFKSRMDELNNFEVNIEPFLLDMNELIKCNQDYEIEAKYLIVLSDSFITFS